MWKISQIKIAKKSGQSLFYRALQARNPEENVNLPKESNTDG